jgi:hypothetical protein
MYALHSWMGELDYGIEPEVECPDNDPNDAAFIWATTIIVGQDAAKEYVPCKIYPLAASFSFESVPLGTTPKSKVETPPAVICCGNHHCGAHRSFFGRGRN